MNRPKWTDYFMALAFLTAERSIDPNTKQGCIITDKENTILSTGYNGPPRGIDDSKVPLTRPGKYDYIIHAEEAAIINAARNGTCLKNCVIYITGVPCEKCIKSIINVGAVELIFPRFYSSCMSDKMVVISDLLKQSNIKLTYYDTSNGSSINNIYVAASDNVNSRFTKVKEASISCCSTDQIYFR